MLVNSHDEGCKSYILEDEAGPAKAWLVEHRHDPRWKQCFDHAYGKRPREELFDLKKDPHQMHNVATDPAYASVVKDLRQRLLSELMRTGDPRLVDNGRFFETPPMWACWSIRPVPCLRSRAFPSIRVRIFVTSSPCASTLDGAMRRGGSGRPICLTTT